MGDTVARPFHPERAAITDATIATIANGQAPTKKPKTVCAKRLAAKINRASLEYFERFKNTNVVTAVKNPKSMSESAAGEAEVDEYDAAVLPDETT